MHVDDTNKYHRYYMIMGQDIMQELGIDIKLSYFMIRGKSPGPFEGYYTPMKYYRELIYIDLNNDIISDQIYDGKPIKDITDHATSIIDANYHKVDLEKVADACAHLGK